MFTRLFALIQTRRSTAFLLARQDDRLLEDIGLTRAGLEALHLGFDTAEVRRSDFRCAAQPFQNRLPA